MRAVIVAAALAASSPAFADECKPLVDFVAVAATAGLSVKPFPSAFVPRLVAAYNAAPPASDDHFDGAAYVEISGGALVLLLRADGVCASVKVPPQAWQHMKDDAFGAAS